MNALKLTACAVLAHSHASAIYSRMVWPGDDKRLYNFVTVQDYSMPAASRFVSAGADWADAGCSIRTSTVSPRKRQSSREHAFNFCLNSELACKRCVGSYQTPEQRQSTNSWLRRHFILRHLQTSLQLDWATITTQKRSVKDYVPTCSWSNSWLRLP